MKKSPWNIDTELGLWWYTTDTPGTGGTLRTSPDDFLVEEIGDHPLKSGPYLVCKLTKTNWDQHRAVKALASGLGMSHQRIGFAGTKDKRAVTTQYISLYKVAPEDIERLSIPGISMTPLGYVQHPINLGDLTENRFQIRIRNITDKTIFSDFVTFHEKIKDGIINYVGYQRFGVTRPVTHLIGLEILKGNFREAVKVMIGKPGTKMQEFEMEARACYLETEDAAAALHLMPTRLSLERSILHHLVQKPDDYLGAIQSLPRTLRSMYVSAVQSWIFNISLSMRIEEGRSLIEPETGDRLIWPDGRTDQATQQTVRAARVQVKRGTCSIGLLLPGGKLVPSSGSDDKNIMNILEENMITTDMFEKVSSVLNTTFAGSFRSVIVKPDVCHKVIDDDLMVEFSLPPGHYATSVLREYMKADPINMV
ncbi:MAG: tRNA pseudouridine(13) synthase TruD [Methanomicrobiales archaeon]|nr:tRNA pseudouridine(13) synthase TruD [Methanomicrobiales archaeon]